MNKKYILLWCTIKRLNQKKNSDFWFVESNVQLIKNYTYLKDEMELTVWLTRKKSEELKLISKQQDYRYLENI